MMIIDLIKLNFKEKPNPISNTIIVKMYSFHIILRFSILSNYMVNSYKKKKKLKKKYVIFFNYNGFKLNMNPHLM